MSYKVIHYFEDLKDFNHPYNVGDEFPHAGMKVSEERLKELSSKENRQGQPLIELVKPKEKVVETLPKEEKKYTKTEINRMPIAELKEVAKSNGIEDAENMTGADLKTELIKHFEL